ncbi:MAG: GntR family transcriptional regulator, partial [Bryobacteraceae bacterium]
MSSTFAFERVSRESTRQRAYAAIRGAILSGQLKTGHHLVEIPLAKELGVGRPLVREALQ